jgi:hypothetical protein
MRNQARLLFFLLAAFLAVPATIRAQPAPGGTLPYTLEGVMAKNQAAAQEAGWFGISAGFIGDDKTPERWIGVTSFLDWNGDPFLGRSVLRALMPSDPTLLFDGPAPMMKQLKTAPPGSKVLIRGMLNGPSRNFMVSGLKVTPAGGKGQ